MTSFQDTEAIKPELKPAELQELLHLDYFIRKLGEYRERELISAEVFETIAGDIRLRRDTISRHGLYRTQLAVARRFEATKDYQNAKKWSTRARMTEPEERAGWELEIRICDQLNRHAEAATLCRSAASRFPDMALRLEELVLDYECRERARQEAEQRRAEQARDLQRALHEKELSRKRPVPLFAAESVNPNSISHQQAEPREPFLSWSSVAGEFLHDHWQKLILCMAVLLIVVSSTVGAHLLLGEKLWSPVGKCSLAMVATLLFAALGNVLVRWGAERAGQMMLITTLIVVPIHFMLAGELRLVLEPSPLRLGGFAFQVAALLGLSAAVAGMLLARKDSWYLAVSLILMSVFNATMARHVVGPWGWQFAAFQSPAVVFVGSVLGLKRRDWEPSADANRRFGNLLVGLLGFALVASLIRTGVYALEIETALYSVPVMLIALGCVHGARWLSAYEPDARQLALMSLGGHVLAGLAFALALARPPENVALFSGNMLATAVLGLLLFGGSLRAERQAAYLYLGFAAFVLSYFGLYYFIRDLLVPIENPARRALIWAGHLPGPYRAINGLAFNLLLGILALALKRDWKNERLARHCHYLGVPLSLVASVYSGFEPTAALICLSGYTSLELLATWVFRSPRVQYLAIASLSGAVYFGSTLISGITLGQQAIEAGLIGLGCSLTASLLQIGRAPDPYRLPWRHGGFVFSSLSMAAATIAMWQVGVPSFPGVWCFLLASLTATVLNREQPGTPIGYLVVMSANVAAGLAVVTGSLTWHWGWGADRYAIIAGAAATADVCFAVSAGAGRREQERSRSLAGSYAWPLAQVGLVLAGGGVGLGALTPITLMGPDAARLIHLAIALAASAAALAIGSIKIDRHELLAHQMVWTGLGGYFCGTLGALVQAHLPHQAATMLMAAAAASLLLIAIWNRWCVPHLRRPLLWAALTLVLAVIPATYLLWRPDWHAAAAFTLSGLALRLIVREMPYRGLVYLALVSFFGVWLKGLGAVPSLEAPTSALWFGLGVGLYDLLLLGVAECLRATLGNQMSLTARPGSSRARMFASQIPPFVIIASFVADAMAWTSLDSVRWCGFLLILAAAGLLWSSRFLRDAAVVYTGLWHAVVGLSCLSCSLFDWHSSAISVAWLAATLAVIALSLWIAALIARTCRLDDVYWVPCLNTALGLIGVVFVTALGARIVGREAFVLAAWALALDSLVCLLVANTRCWSGLIYATVSCFVAATYMVLLSSEHPDPKMAYVLGLNAVVQAIGCWGLGDACRRSKNPWPRNCALPLFYSALVLTMLAVPPAFRSPVTMSLVAVSFLLTVKSLPSERWIYATLAALGTAVYFRWLDHQPWIHLIVACIGFAYALWTLGLLVRHGRTTLATRLGLKPLDYEIPVFDVAAVLGLTAFLLKSDGRFGSAADLTARAWVPVCLAPLALGMVRGRARREFLHASLLLIVWGLCSLIAPSLDDVHFLTLAIVVCSLVLQLIDLILRPVEERLWDRLAIQGVRLESIVRGWWLVLGLCGLIACMVMVTRGMVGTMTYAAPAMSPAEWWAITASIVLVCVQIALAGLDADLRAVILPEGVIAGVELTGATLLWWLGVAGSPLASWHLGHWNLQAGQYYPLVTGLTALILADWNSRLGPRTMHLETSSRPEAIDAGRLRLLLPAVMLSFLAPALTLGHVDWTTAATFVSVTFALGFWAIRDKQWWAAYPAGLTWCAAGLVSGLLVGRDWGWAADGPRSMSAALGELASVYTLAGIAGWFRQRRSSLALGSPAASLDSQAASLTLGLILERVAFCGSLLVAGFIANATDFLEFAGPRVIAPGAGVSVAAIGALLALALLYLSLTRRWKAEWLVYLAQGCLVWAYMNYRLNHPLAASADAAILVLFAFADLGIAEVLERFQLPLVARPTRYVSLLLPILPLVRLLEIGGLNDATVFRLLAAGTFYAVACGTMQWKTLGYAAGVLYNAALWVLWGKMGWQLADHTQFYFVPVGLSAILFAETNRRGLGRQTVNTIRSAGLITVYLALAVPIWEFRSFEDWVVLLLCSLLGLFAGIGLRVQTFVWLGLVTFVADVLYELGRISLDHALAKWAIMLSLGIALVFFVALNEKKQIVATMRGYYEQVRTWN